MSQTKNEYFSRKVLKYKKLYNESTESLDLFRGCSRRLQGVQIVAQINHTNLIDLYQFYGLLED